MLRASCWQHLEMMERGGRLSTRPQCDGPAKRRSCHSLYTRVIIQGSPKTEAYHPVQHPKFSLPLEPQTMIHLLHRALHYANEQSSKGGSPSSHTLVCNVAGSCHSLIASINNCARLKYTYNKTLIDKNKM